MRICLLRWVNFSKPSRRTFWRSCLCLSCIFFLLCGVSVRACVFAGRVQKKKNAIHALFEAPNAQPHRVLPGHLRCMLVWCTLCSLQSCWQLYNQANSPKKTPQGPETSSSLQAQLLAILIVCNGDNRVWDGKTPHLLQTLLTICGGTSLALQNNFRYCVGVSGRDLGGS